MDTYHAALWSSSPYSTNETELPTTKGPSSVEGTPGQVSSAIWRNGHGRRYWKARDPGHRLGSIAVHRRNWRQLRLSGKPERHPQKCIGGGTWGVWQSQVGDLCQLPVLTVAGVVLVRHRVMWWSGRCPQYAFLAQCATAQLPVSARLG
jgi:hypothetical protein